MHEVLAPAAPAVLSFHRHAHFLKSLRQQGMADRPQIDRHWSAECPDLNLIELLRMIMGTNTRRRLSQPTNLQEIQDALHEELTAIPLQLISRLILPMHRRSQTVIQATGGHTKY